MDRVPGDRPAAARNEVKRHLIAGVARCCRTLRAQGFSSLGTPSCRRSFTGTSGTNLADFLRKLSGLFRLGVWQNILLVASLNRPEEVKTRNVSVAAEIQFLLPYKKCSRIVFSDRMCFPLRPLLPRR